MTITAGIWVALGNRPCLEKLEVLRENAEYLLHSANHALYLYNKCKEWDERYEEMKRKEMGE